MTDKLDFKKIFAGYRAPQGWFEIVEIPDQQYLMVDGHGDPNTSPAYIEALAALYPVAYKLKLASKRELARGYVVPPLEGCGGRTTWMSSPQRATSPAGTGR